MRHSFFSPHRFIDTQPIPGQRLSATVFILFLMFVTALQAAAQQDPTPRTLPTHVVQPGETLSEIAEEYGVSLTRLMLFNGINDANAVTVGQELTIPTSEFKEEIPTATATMTATAFPPTATATTAPPIEATTATSPTATQTTPPEASTGEVVEPTQVPSADVASTGTAESAALPAAAASLNRAYTVTQGDTFARIALRTGVDPEALRQLNRLDPENLNDLYIGQTLLLPATGDDLRVQRSTREYVVAPGDTLGSIANQFELSLAELLTANFITDPDSLSIGQRLTIPPPSTADEEEGEAFPVGPARSGFYYYTVQPGDTLSALAKAFDSTKLALLEYNGLPDEETVYSGIELRIPYGPPTLPDRRPHVPASGTSFVVSLSRQQCWLYRGNRVIREWTCSTGYGEWITRTGTFAVQSKIEVAQSNAYRLDMPYWLGIYNVGPYENGIHGLPVDWDTGEKIWEGLIGEPATFGCAMLDDPDAAELFATAYIGMPIHVTN
ncbi:MAG: LysM peptidoglycan-binding domain-containing protein [Caldilineaceae bacterium]|nr:LysM peptidoglycan-binding domain-containing protein [Caldilineaceae bacterium]